LNDLECVGKISNDMHCHAASLRAVSLRQLSFLYWLLAVTSVEFIRWSRIAVAFVWNDVTVHYIGGRWWRYPGRQGGRSGGGVGAWRFNRTYFSLYVVRRFIV